MTREDWLEAARWLLPRLTEDQRIALYQDMLKACDEDN